MLESRGDKPEIQLTGIPTLNRANWGIHRRKNLVIAARPSNGKTAMAIAVAQDIALQGFRVYFISLEMTATDIMERMFCQKMKIDNQVLLQGGMKYRPDIVKAYTDWANDMYKTKLIISDMIGKSAEDVDDVIENMSQKPDVIIIDHINEISAGGETKHIAIDKYIEAMRTCCIRHNFALIMCNQVNRIGQNEKSKEPQLHHLKGSGGIEEKADQVWLLHWDFHYTHEEAEINKFQVHIAKNRNGRTGYVNLFFQPEYYRFSDFGEEGARELNQKLSTVTPHMED